MEYDENRNTIAREIGIRFISIFPPGTNVPITETITKTDNNYHSASKTNQHFNGGCSGDKDDLGIEEVDSNCIDSKDLDKSGSWDNNTENLKQSISTTSCNDLHSRLRNGNMSVLDVLNDVLIAKVREKITSMIVFVNIKFVNINEFYYLGGSKDLFEPCVVSVKSFLAGEPFREFEASMYFHRFAKII